MKKAGFFLTIAAISSLIVLASACGTGTGNQSNNLKEIAQKKVSDSLIVTISNEDGKLKTGNQGLVLTFTDGAGKPIKISAAALNFNMPAMGTMAEMNAATNLSTTSTPGEFKGSVDISMAGDWIAQITYEGDQTGKTTISVTAH